MLSFDRSKMCGRTIIIFGGGIYGEIAYQVITKIYGGTVEVIIDNKYNSVPWTDQIVVRSNDLKKYHGADVLICAANAFTIIQKEVEQYKKNDMRAYDIRNILREYQHFCGEQKIESSNIYGDINIDEMILKYDYYAGVSNGYDEMLYLPYCVLCITNRCTLKCKNCAAFINKYQNKADYEKDSLIVNFAKIVDAVDGITELELMGGEPFLHREFGEILRWCIGQKKIHGVKIITNGTILPRPEIWELLKNSKVKLVIDDYGTLSGKLNHICEMAEQYGIHFERQKLQTWYQIEPICKKNLTVEEMQEIYYNCVFKTSIGMTNGKFYHCNVSGHMHNTGLLPDEEVEYIQIENKDWQTDELRREIKSFLSKQYLRACSYCNYGSHIEVRVAEQSD